MKTLKVNLELLADQANALAEHCFLSHKGEDWYEGLSNFLGEIEHHLSVDGELTLVETKEK